MKNESEKNKRTITHRKCTRTIFVHGLRSIRNRRKMHSYDFCSRGEKYQKSKENAFVRFLFTG